MASAIFMESGGDATGGFEFWSSTTGTLSVQGTTTHTGADAIKCNPGGGSQGYVRKNGVLADAGRCISFWFQTAALDSADMEILEIDDPSPSFIAYLTLTSGGLLKLNSTGVLGTGSTVLSINTWYRISVSYTITNTTVYTMKVYLNGNLEITGSGTLARTGTDVIRLGLLITTNAITAYYDDIYVDDRSDGSDCGDVRVTAKLPTTVNANNFDTTVGSGAVNERPLSETNGKQQAASSQVSQNYNLETASAGDVDISASTVVARAAWIWAKEAAVSGTPKITNNGTDTGITLAVTSALYTNLVTSATYPSDAAGIGMVSSGTADDTFLYECGMLVAYTPTAGATTAQGMVAVQDLIASSGVIGLKWK